MKYYHRIKIKGYPPLPNNAGKHWAQVNASRKTWHRLTAAAITHKPDQPIEKCKVICIKYSSRKCDFDGLVYSFKPVIDGLVLVGIIKDDDMDTIVQREYHWVKVKEVDSFVTIQIEEL